MHCRLLYTQKNEKHGPATSVSPKGWNSGHYIERQMGGPQYITPMIDVTNKAFAARACKAGNEQAIRFSNPKGEQKRAMATVFSAIRRRTVITLLEFGLQG